MSSIATTEKIEFDVHPHIIQDLVHSQNGTVATGIRELVLNAIDAKSPNVEIMIGTTEFIVEDQGRGFASKEEVMAYFKTFGAPHEKGDATYGRFRIGRGQIMSLAKVTWTSNQYSMSVDVRNDGMAFKFKGHDESQHEGCRVSGTFYEELSSYDLRCIQEELEQHIRYAPCKVTLNGQLLNADPAKERWDIQDEDVRIRWGNTDGIRIYSNGIFVKSLHRFMYGFSAVVLTQNNLVLNMARNEINIQDPLWIKINKYLRSHAESIAKRKGKGGRVSPELRRSMIRMFLSGEMDPSDVLDVVILKNCTGRSNSLTTVFFNKDNMPVTVSPDMNSSIAESISRQGRALVFDPETLEEFKVKTLKELFAKISESLLLYQDNNRHVVTMTGRISHRTTAPFIELAATVLSETSLIPAKKYSPRQRAARNALQHGANLMARELTKIYGKEVKKRKVLLGKGHSLAWTNGFDMIAFTDITLKFLDTQGRGGGMQMALILLHEYLHDSSDEDSHDHSPEFMDQYHDLTSNPYNNLVSTVATGLYSKYLSELANNCQDLPKKVKGDFRYPVVNDVIQYVITLKPEGLSDFEKLILKNFVKAPLTRRQGKLVITRGRRGIKCFVSNNWRRFATLNGIDVQAFDDFCDGIRAKSLSDEHRQYKQYLAEQLHRHYEQTSGHDLEFFKRLVKANYLSDLLAVLSTGWDSGISHIEHEFASKVKRIWNDRVSYTHSIEGPFPGEFWGADRFLQTHNKHRDFAGTKEGRLNYARHIVAHAFMGLRDPDEKKELLSLINDKAFGYLMNVNDKSNRINHDL